jgi:hypothetical protein
MRPLHLRPLIPPHIHPPQISQDGVLRLSSGACLVGIFNADYELAAGLFCQKPVEQRCARAAHVQRACRRGCEAHTHGAHLHAQSAGELAAAASHGQGPEGSHAAEGAEQCEIHDESCERAEQLESTHGSMVLTSVTERREVRDADSRRGQEKDIQDIRSSLSMISIPLQTSICKPFLFRRSFRYFYIYSMPIFRRSCLADTEALLVHVAA